MPRQVLSSLYEGSVVTKSQGYHLVQRAERQTLRISDDGLTSQQLQDLLAEVGLEHVAAAGGSSVCVAANTANPATIGRPLSFASNRGSRTFDPKQVHAILAYHGIVAPIRF